MTTKQRSRRAKLISLGMALLFLGGMEGAAQRVRPIPPPGQEIAEADRREIETRAVNLAEKINLLRARWEKSGEMRALIPEVEIFHKAVTWAVEGNQVFNATNEVPAALKLLDMGLDRAFQLLRGEPGWTTQTGLVARAYVSKIDGSIQPYGLVIPGSHAATPDVPRRLDIWFHGRDERLSELNFVWQRTRSAGEFTAPNTIVLHLYGRYCNANKFAGEVDLFEALEHVRRHYAIDENRIVVRGFSMGGAACWQFATHHAGLWAAAAPGAGFSESARFLGLDPADPSIPAHQKTLWHWYDCTDYALNLFNLPTVAYSGENDRQKQAADMMEAALAREGIPLAHVIGPKTEHRYHPDSKTEINRRIDAIAAAGRDPYPPEIRFATWTLRYNEMKWLKLTGLEKHWVEARVRAVASGGSKIRVDTTNVTSLELALGPGQRLLGLAAKPTILLDGVELEGPLVSSDGSWSASFAKEAGVWRAGGPAGAGLRKKPGLQGPIDDAFMDSFRVVGVDPKDTPFSERTAAWYDSESARGAREWKRQFRGEVRMVEDAENPPLDGNLALWGDPRSNVTLGKIAGRLPIQWDKEGIQVGGKRFSADHHVLAMIYPNPLNPERYVVLNSLFTFRELDYLNNARQVAKLPDWAVINVSEPTTPEAPGRVVASGFFDEAWRLAE